MAEVATDPFDLPPLNGFPFGGEENGHTQYNEFDDEAQSIHSDEFVDGEAFMAENQLGEDSFLREATGSADVLDWSDAEDPIMVEMDTSRRASDIFVTKSRDMENVQFSSPQRTIRKTTSSRQEVSLRTKHFTTHGNFTSPAFSQTNTAMSSEFDIHVDSRLVLTPNSLKYLQLQQQNRLGADEFNLSESKLSSAASIVDGHSVLARQIAAANSEDLVHIPEPREAGPSSAQKAMQAGPSVIKRALHEIEAMLHPPEFDSADNDYDSTLQKLRQRLLEKPIPVSVHDVGFDASRSTGIDANGATKFHKMNQRLPIERDGMPNESSPTQDSADESTLNKRDELRSGHGQRPASTASTGVQAEPQGELGDRHFKEAIDAMASDEVVNSESAVKVAAPVRPSEAQMKASFRRSAYRESVDPLDRARELLGSHSYLQTTSVGEHPATSNAHDRLHPREKVESTAVHPRATALPTKMARRCRRLLCSVGEKMTEQIVFSNGSNAVGRICVSILPLSMGCQQFAVSPAVLELAPHSSSAFVVTFHAKQPGVVAGIFQFRAVGKDRLYDPYEVLIEASVRGDLQLPPSLSSKQTKSDPPAIESRVKSPRVTELPSQILAGVQISPTFLRLTPPSDEGSTKARVRVTNTTSQTLKFQVKCSHEHIHVSTKRGKVEAGSSAAIELEVLSQPYGWNTVDHDWCGSMTVIVEDLLSRELSLVIDRKMMATLPAFHEVARLRQSISTQTDSFYYTKKVNRRGLYFHARAVECGSCTVGESHQVPVFICNGSDAPMTVFLQALQEPFSCLYQPTTLQARKFIEVPVTFKPKAPGKVATCLIAYTVNAKAAVTLIARGVEKKQLLQG